jgi:hypothetical protein
LPGGPETGLGGFGPAFDGRFTANKKNVSRHLGEAHLKPQEGLRPPIFCQEAAHETLWDAISLCDLSEIYEEALFLWRAAERKITAW